MNIQMIVTYVIIDMFCIIMAFEMRIHLNSDFGSEFEVKTLKKGMDSYCCFLIFGLVWLMIQNGLLIYNIPLLWISNSLSIFFMGMSSFYWFVFSITKLSGRKAFSNKIIYRLSLMPVAATALICAISPWTGLAFTITSDGQYFRGPLFIYISSISYIYDLIILANAIYFSLRAKNSEDKKLCRIFGIIIIFPMTAGIIQLIISGTPIIAPAVIVAVFLVFVTIQSSQINNDALTGLNNRRKACEFLEKEVSQSGTDYHVILYMIDADRFKQINDRYGHVEGDKALRIIADTLVILASRYSIFVSRYGGDEFMIIDSGKNCSNPNIIVSELNKELVLKCEKEKIQYSLTVSSGYTVSSEKNAVANDLIRAADANLYKAKAKIHGNRR